MTCTPSVSDAPQVRHVLRRSSRSRGFAAKAGSVVVSVVVGTAALFVLAGCGGQTAAVTGAASGAAAPEKSEVTLIMDWVPWVLDIPVDVAQEREFYADHGLTVKQVIPAGATDVVKFVSTGKAQFGLYYAPDTLAGVAEGAPLLSVAALMSHAPVGMAMAPGVHARKPADLAGTTAGVVLVPSTRASFETMLKTGGVDPSAVKVADPGFDLVPPLLAGRYDSVAVTQFGELVQADQAGQQLDYLDFRDWGTPDYAFLNVVTQKDFASQDPATVRAFVAATTEGLEWALAHPEDAVALYVERHPELKGDLLLAQWKAAAPSMAAASGGHVAGRQDVGSWKALDSWMVSSGQITTPVDVSGVVTDEYLPAR
jgi:ABC-type nitrate/sulfonate/bicarbonate transport system substrate-binding protein